MLKSQIYIVQLVGVILLLCAYLLGDQPDRLSVMHFNTGADCQHTIKKANRHAYDNASNETYSSNGRHPVRKSRAPKFISYEVVLLSANSYTYHPYTAISYAFPLPENYTYLFFEEINPPPPKAC